MLGAVRRLLSVLALAALAVFGGRCGRGRASGPLPQEAYVWQRAWTPAVREAVGRAADFRSLVILGAEVDLSSRPPRIARPAIAWDILKGRPVGLALRIGRFHGWGGGTGKFADDPETVRRLAGLAGDLAREARSHKLDIREIQLDYDCPESKLADYPVLVDAVGRAVAPTPVTLTALPSWLRHERAFKTLARSADGFVLQVHFLRTPSRPPSPDTAVELVDPQEAVRAVEQAARAGVPFRVALPTYSYGAVFDERGALLGLAAEGGRSTGLPEVTANPAVLARLVQAWTNDRPEEMQGLIWYRLPTADDARNWPWETLRAVMTGRVPRTGMRAEIREPKPLLHEIDLVNTGEADAALTSPLHIRWDSDTLMAADAIAGTRLFRTGPREARLEAPATIRPLRPGERRTVAWLRFTRPAEVHVEIPSP